MFFKKTVEYKNLFRLSLITVFLAFAVIALGAFTRLVDAGLGCPDWPGCYGHLLWPNQAHEIAEAEAKFPDAPVELEKTWPEMVHRYLAGTLGLVILVILSVAIRLHRQDRQAPLKLPILLLAMVVLQAAFGMWTVTLKLWPQVVTAHLLGGFCTLSLLWLLAQRLGALHWRLAPQQNIRLRNLRPLLWLALALVVVQIALGGWVSANYAALACPDLPLCFQQWLPPADFRAGFDLFQHIGPNYLGGQLDNEARTAIHLSHRLGALLVTLTILLLGWRLWRLGSRQIQFWVLLLWGVLTVQLGLGISNILLALPLYVAVGHNAVGAVLLLTIISIVHHSYSARIDTNR